MGSKRAKEQAGLHAATAAMNKRVEELTWASVRKGQTLKTIERTVFWNSTAMRGTPAAQTFLARTAALMQAEMEEEYEQARVRREQMVAERTRAAAEKRIVQLIEDAKAKTGKRGAATRAARLATRASTAAAAALSDVKVVRSGKLLPALHGGTDRSGRRSTGFKAAALLGEISEQRGAAPTARVASAHVATATGVGGVGAVLRRGVGGAAVDAAPQRGAEAAHHLRR